MEKMMSTVDKPEMIKLREEAGAKIETQTFVKLIVTLGAEGSFGTSFDKIASIEFTKRLQFGSGV